MPVTSLNLRSDRRKYDAESKKNAVKLSHASSKSIK